MISMSIKGLNTRKRMKIRGIRLAFAVALGLSACAAGLADDKRKVVYVDSYHEGYPWSDGVTEGVQKSLGDKVELKILRMDTKRNSSEEFKKAAGERAKAEIDAWKPDVVIASDDNAAKYLLVPFLKDKERPCVFCGLNWDASTYGFPCSNITGMVEVALVKPLLISLKRYAKGDRVGHIGKNNETDRKEGYYIAKKFELKLDEAYVDTFEQWKKEYLALQDRVDMLIVQNNAGIADWNDEEARKFILENTKIPTGALLDFMAPFVLVAYGRSAQEQGEWAGYAALLILGGTAPSEIPVSENKRAKVYLNLPIANKLGVKFPFELIKSATIIKE